MPSSSPLRWVTPFGASPLQAAGELPSPPIDASFPQQETGISTRNIQKFNEPQGLSRFFLKGHNSTKSKIYPDLPNNVRLQEILTFSQNTGNSLVYGCSYPRISTRFQPTLTPLPPAAPSSKLFRCRRPRPDRHGSTWGPRPCLVRMS